MKTIVYLILALFTAVAFITFTPVDSPQATASSASSEAYATVDSAAMTATNVTDSILARLILTLTVLAAVSLGLGRLVLNGDLENVLATMKSKLTANTGKYEVGWQSAKLL